MSRDRGRRFHNVVVEPSASALLEAVSQAGKGSGHSELHESLRHDDALNRQPSSSYFALNFNFKPDSTHDCKKGTLFQPGLSRNPNADWQLELEGNETEHEAGPSTGFDDTSRKKPAHVFTGPQTSAKAYDLVLVWDSTAKVYRLDRIASTFSLKYERSKTVLSSQSQEAWSNDALKPKKRPTHDISSTRLPASAHSLDRKADPPSSATTPLRDHSIQVADRSRPGELKLRSKTSTVMAPVRRSSRRSMAVEMEEFDDGPQPASEPSASTSTGRSKRGSISQEAEPSGKTETKKAKASAAPEKPASPVETASTLRRSRRRSSQAQIEEASSPPHGRRSSGASEPAIAEKVEEPESLEAEDVDLALELERELEREIEIEMEDVNETEEPAPSFKTKPAVFTQPRPDRSLSPASRLKHSDRQMKINTPKAHTPDIEEGSAIRPSSLSKSFGRSVSPTADDVASMDEVESTAPQTTASIGLGLQQTGVGITPTASPHLDVSSPAPGDTLSTDRKREENVNEEDVREDDDEDDDLQDFAAELDMSLAEPSDAPPVAAPAVAEKRRSSRSHAITQNRLDTSARDLEPRQVRKTYGLGGPRQEEEELEDSD